MFLNLHDNPFQNARQLTVKHDDPTALRRDNRAMLHSPTASAAVVGRRLIHRVRMNSGRWGYDKLSLPCVFPLPSWL